MIIRKPDVIPPSAPVIKSYQIVAGGVSLLWIKSPEVDVVSHILLKKELPMGQTWDPIATVAEDSTKTDNQIKAGKRYAYALIAQDQSGLQSKPSLPIIVQIPLNFAPIASFANFSATLNTPRKQIDITWAYPDPNVSEFQLYRATNDEKMTLWKVLDASETGISESNLTENTTYHYAIQAIFIDGKTSEWREAIVVYQTGADGFIFNPQSNSPRCVGQSLSLSVASGIANAYTFNWTGPNNFTSTEQNPTLASTSLASKGIYSVTLSNTINSVSISASISVNIFAQPTATIIAPVSVCAGETLVLDASGNTPTETYSWSGSNFSSTLRSPNLSNLTAGSYLYSVKITNGTEACSATASVSVVVREAPTVTIQAPNLICEGTTLNISATGVPAQSTLQWIYPGGFTSRQATLSFPTAPLTADGIYSLSIGLPGSCTITATTSVKIAPRPQPSVGFSTPICGGNPLQLNALGNISGQTYAWAGSNNFSSTVQNPVVTGLALGTYQFSVTANNPVVANCTASVSVSIQVVAIPTVTIAIPAQICQGQAANLSSGDGLSGIASINWQGPNTYKASGANPVISNAQPEMSGIYTVQANNAGCVATATASMKVFPLPTATITHNNPKCNYQTLSLSVSGGLSNEQYSWSGSYAFSSTIKSPSISPLVVGARSYSVTVRNADYTVCLHTASVSLSIIQAPTPNLTVSSTYGCAGSPLQINSNVTSTSYTYSWNGPGAFSSTLNSVSFSPVSTTNNGTYTITVRNGECTATNTATVSVSPTPSVTITKNSATCTNQSLQLTVSGGLSAETYQWSGTNTFTSTLGAPVIASPIAGTHNYSVTVRNSSNTACFATSSISLSIKAINIPTIQAPSAACVGRTFQLTASDGYGNTLPFAWTGPNNFTTTQKSPSFSNATTAMTGIYSLTVTGTNSCTASASVSVSVFANPQATISSNLPICSGDNINLTANGGISGEVYSWRALGGAFTSTEKSPVITSTYNTYIALYPSISLTVSLSNTCSFTSTASVSITSYSRPVVIVSVFPATQTVCSGSTLNLSMTVSQYAQPLAYKWDGPGGFTSSLKNPTVNPVLESYAGVLTAKVSLTTATICFVSATTSLQVIKRPVPVFTTNSPIARGQTLQLSVDGGTSDETYAWTGPNGFSSFLKSPSIANFSLAAGSYTYSATIIKGPCISSGQVVVQVTN